MSSSNKARVPVLDSLRGLAALGVCIGHSLAVFPLSDDPGFLSMPLSDLPLQLWPYRIIDAILNPRAAVIFFFVLSGYVLTHAYERSPSWQRYFVRRQFRLFPPLIVSVFGMWAVGNWSVGQMPAGTVASPFAVTMFLHNVAWDDIWLNSLLITTDINKVTWTVVVEFWGSLLLPVLLYGMARFNAWAVIFALLVMALIPHQLAGLAQLYCFACGAMIARHPWPDRLPAGWLAVASAAVLILAAEWPAEPWLRDMILTAGASGLIVAVLRRPFGLLSLRPLLALGEVSYSLYLLHPAALGIAFVAAARLGLLGAPGAWFLVVLSLAIAIPLAMLSRKYVELPAISLGRRLVERSRPIRHGATAQAVS